MSLKGKTILVTGAAGVLGSALVKKFLGVFILFSLKKLLNSFNVGLFFSLFKKDKDKGKGAKDEGAAAEKDKQDADKKDQGKRAKNEGRGRLPGQDKFDMKVGSYADTTEAFNDLRIYNSYKKITNKLCKQIK